MTVAGVLDRMATGSFDPRGTRLLRKIVLALGAAAALLLLVGLVSPVANRVSEDESNLVYDAQRLTLGQMPYRDFFSFIPPGIYYALAGFSQLTALPPETSERYLVLLAALLAFMAFVMAVWRSAGSLPLVLMSLVLPAGLYPFAPFSSPHHSLSMACLLGMLAFLPRLWEGNCGRMSLLLFGCMAGLAGAFVQTEGVVAAVLLLFATLAGSKSVRDFLHRLLWSVAGALGVAGACLIPLALSGTLAGFWRDAVLWPSSHYRRIGNINDFPFLGDVPSSLAALWTWPPEQRLLGHLLRAVCGTLLYAGIGAGCAAALALMLWTLAGFFRARRAAPSQLTAAVLTALAFGLFLAGRTSWTHLVFACVPALGLWLLALGPVLSQRPAAGRALMVVASVLLICSAAYHGRALYTRFPEEWEFTDVDRVDRECPLDRSLRASPFLKPGDTIVVLPTGGNVYLYTYPSAIGYTYLFPLADGYHDLEDHERAAAEIQERKPKLILIHVIRLKAFLGDDGPLARVIQKDYRPSPGSPAVALFVRNGA